jgi:hypothetical protein
VQFDPCHLRFTAIAQLDHFIEILVEPTSYDVQAVVTARFAGWSPRTVVQSSACKVEVAT